jgi:hypothetical protein
MPLAATGSRPLDQLPAKGGRSGLLGRVVVVMAVGALGLVGCTANDGNTCDVATEDISAVALVIDSGWDIRAAIDFEAGDRRGGNSPLRLCDSDRLTINGTVPQRVEKADRIEYAVSLPADGARSFEIMLDRDSEGDRVEFSVELPPAFEVVAPEAGAVIDFAQDQVLQWEPPVPDGSLRVELGEVIGAGECLTAMTEGHTYEAGGGVTVPDNGQWTIPAGSVASMGTEDCTLTYTLSRVLLAPYPEAFEGSGRLEARTERYLDVVVLR